MGLFKTRKGVQNGTISKLSVHIQKVNRFWFISVEGIHTPLMPLPIREYKAGGRSDLVTLIRLINSVQLWDTAT